MGWLFPETALIAVHIAANVVWIGSILSVALLVSNAPFMADPVDVGTMARRVYLRLSVPAFLVSFLGGVGKLALSPGVYLHMPWMHAKLTLAFVVIVLHHAIGARARRVAGGQVASARGVGLLGIALFVTSVGVVFLGVNKSLP